MTGVRLEPPSHHDYIGTEFANDEPSGEFDLRVKRCYELALFGQFSDNVQFYNPILIHGTWHGPGAPQRIGHAWLKLDYGTPIAPRLMAWEPIRGNLYNYARFIAWVAGIEEVAYTRLEALQLMRRTGHAGRWHDSEYP